MSFQKGLTGSHQHKSLVVTISNFLCDVIYERYIEPADHKNVLRTNEDCFVETKLYLDSNFNILVVQTKISRTN